MATTTMAMKNYEDSVRTRNIMPKIACKQVILFAQQDARFPTREKIWDDWGSLALIMRYDAR